jgi:hypothetical protein
MVFLADTTLSEAEATIGKSKKDIQCNDKEKGDKTTNNDLQNTTRKIQD